MSALTPTELRVLQLTANGMTSIEAAKYLELSSHTIKTHKANIMLKLGVLNMTEACVFGMHYSLITYEGR